MCLREPGARRRQRRYAGSIYQLQQVIRMTRVVGEWQYMPAGYWRFVGRDGAILNWWPSTGTINFQGPFAAASAFERALIEVVARGQHPERALPDMRRRD